VFLASFLLFLVEPIAGRHPLWADRPVWIMNRTSIHSEETRPNSEARFPFLAISLADAEFAISPQNAAKSTR